MIKKITWKSLVIFTGLLSLVAYFSHVVIGTMLYEGYDPLSQAISDLTADDSPVKTLTRTLAHIYGFFSVITVYLLYRFSFYQSTKRLRWGMLCFGMMIVLSAIGYALFPLSEAGYAGSFQDIMHMVITVLVVLLTVASLILFYFGFNIKFAKYYTLFAFISITISPLLMVVFGPNLFGLFERISVYTVVIYLGFLVFMSLNQKAFKGDLNETEK